MKLGHACLVLSFTLLACGSSSLPKPELLERPKSEWPARIKLMNTRDLFYVYRYQLSLPPPEDTSFAEYLGPKGKAVIDLWITGLEERSNPAIDRTWLFAPLIQQVAVQSGYSLCSDPKTLDRAIKALAKQQFIGSEVTAAQMIDESCLD